MKKLFHLLVFAFATSAMQAQNNDMYTLMSHDWPGNIIPVQGLMQQHDGEFIINTFAWTNPDETPLGNVIYKISPSSLSISDSLFMEDTIPSCFFAPNPHGEGNIRTHFEYHESCDSSFLRISHFSDNNLNVNPNEDVMVPLCEGYAYGLVSCVDSNDDLVLKYFKQSSFFESDVYAARIGLDGTLKCNVLLSESQSNDLGNFYVLKESPLEYYQWGSSDNYLYDNLILYVVDTLFQRNPIIISSILSEEVINPLLTATEYLFIQYDTEVIPIGGDEILVAAEYVYEASNNTMERELGVTVAKYDIRTMQLKDYIVFNDYPSIYRPAQCLGLKMMSDGTVYFLYKETGYPDESFIAVKMDTDLNVEWKRFCKTDISIESLDYCILYKDEQGEEQGIAWVGNGTNTSTNKMGLVLLFLNHDGPVGINESSIEVRPYAFYPNPAKEQLHMQFSPDVKPTLVELYDLQGRLVRTQDNNFEGIDLSLLPAGTYSMRVILENGEVYSDKVVKE